MEIEGASGITNLAIVVLGYPFDLCDPILGVWLEVSCIWIPPGRHDQDAGEGDSGQSSE